MKIAVIPARGGSKRIPRKNIKLFCGKPMIAWSIEAAVSSGCFDRIMVSTDDAEIAEVAVRAGAEAPFVRPTVLSDDHASTMEVVAHAIDWMASVGLAPEFVCCVYATAPFLRVDDLRRGLVTLQESDAKFTVSATSYAFPIQRAFRLDAGGRMEMFQPENFAVRSQDLEPAYHDAAQFYWGRTDAWKTSGALFSSASIPILLPRDRVQDIDTGEDWARAELMARIIREGE